MIIQERINSLRALMEQENLQAFIVNGNDPHLSEYVPQRWKTRQWISGFTGSAGRVVVTTQKVALWTDSRYFLQAEAELKDSGIILMKDRQADSVPYEDWLLADLPENSRVGIDGFTLSVSEKNKLDQKLGAKGITLIKDRDLVDEIWHDRPPLPDSQAYDYVLQFAGVSRTEKIKLIREKLTVKKANATLITMLDDLAWTFNLRGNDIDFSPLVMAYGFIDQENAILFIKNSKLSSNLKFSLESENIQIRDYDEVISFLESCNTKIIIDPDRVNCLLADALLPELVIQDISIPLVLKSVKNDTEIVGMKEAHRKDGIAMINFLFWISNNISKEKITELDVCRKLSQFRSEQMDYSGESFFPIVGYNAHGAIVHYHVTPEFNSVLKPEGILLIDSGGQYLDGTTDITRTISLGEASEQVKKDFTLVLKGMIQLAKIIFPYNSTGSSLDILARKALWENALDYGHGTGHGVGHFLCVHEGPISIRQVFTPFSIQEGNIISDEPGLYKDGEYGIRIENLILCRKDKESNFGKFLSFETLTLCPIDKKLIAPELLNPEEISWLNAYHQRILNEIGPYLRPEVLDWLKIQCSAL